MPIYVCGAAPEAVSGLTKKLALQGLLELPVTVCQVESEQPLGFGLVTLNDTT